MNPRLFEEVAASLTASAKRQFNINRADHFAAQRKKMQHWLAKAEEALGKPMPADFVGFYSIYQKWRVLERTGSNCGGQINDLPTMFDRFKPRHPDLGEKNPTVVHRTARKYAFYGRLWLEEHGQTQSHWEHFNNISRLKELVSIDGTGTQIVVDFHDEKKEYVMCYFNGRADELFPLNIALEEFLVRFLYFDTGCGWYYAFLSKRDFQKAGVSAKEILKDVKKEYGRFKVYAKPIAELSRRLRALEE